LAHTPPQDTAALAADRALDFGLSVTRTVTDLAERSGV